ncbi:MAG: GAF domain-containing protein [Anaerolineae bacterium]
MATHNRDNAPPQLSHQSPAATQSPAELDALTAERALMEQALQASQLRFTGILDIAHEAIISTDQAQRIILYNKGAEQIFGYTADEALGRPLDILIPQMLVARHQNHVAEFAAAPDSARLMGERQEISGQRKDGAVFPAEASISKLNVGGKLIFTVVLRDISARKEAEREREHLISQLRALNEAAQAITAELSLDQVLQKIAEAAQTLMNVEYAALGVHDGQGHLSRFITAGITPQAYHQIGALPTGRGLLGDLLYQGQSVLINNISRHPAATGFPEHHPPMRNLLGTPIYSKGSLIGALYLADKKDHTGFSEADRQLVERLALHAAIAIENARVYEQTQRLAILEERDRFARDLHDGIIQSIYAVGLVLDQTKLDIPHSNRATIDQIDLSLKNLAKVIQDIRNYIFDLRPQALKNQGLKARLEGLIKEIQVNTLLPIHTEISPGINNCLSEWQASNIFHICHEALANAVRHAAPSHISVTLVNRDDTVTLRVDDNGIGFEPPPDINPGHRGLSNIRARVAQLGANLHLDSAPRQGTRITVTLKVDPSA